MDFEVYCDESCQDVFTSQKSKHQYMLIGGLWLLAKNRSAFKYEIRQIRKKHNVFGEIKWNKISPSKIEFYLDIVNYFFDKKEDLRFRCIVIDRNEVNIIKYHDSDAELGFYKFYYQLIHHWILDFNSYSIFLDIKTNRVRNRLKILHRCLNYSNLSSEIKRVQAVPSSQSVFIQLTDLLLGAVGAKFNDSICSPSKINIISLIEKRLGHEIRPTGKYVNKFNVFKIDLKGEKE